MAQTSTGTTERKGESGPATAGYAQCQYKQVIGSGCQGQQDGYPEKARQLVGRQPDHVEWEGELELKAGGGKMRIVGRRLAARD